MPNDTYVAPSIQPSGTTFAQFQAGGFSLLIDNLIAANGPIADPTTAATVSVGGTGGQLSAGTYQVAYTFRDSFGETDPGGQSGAFTVAAGQVATVTLPALPPNADEIWLYVSPVNTPTGPLSLYATGITATTYAMTTAVGSDPLASPPSANTTGAGTVAYKIRGYRSNSYDRIFEGYSDFVSGWLSGQPLARRDARILAQQWAAVFAVWDQAGREAAALMLLNPGTLGYQYPAVGTAAPIRTWP
jgi:hypothetical protein